MKMMLDGLRARDICGWQKYQRYLYSLFAAELCSGARSDEWLLPHEALTAASSPGRKVGIAPD
jgi:hypothetical protein